MQHPQLLNPQTYGGESFVELFVGLNLAFTAFEQFSYRTRYATSRINTILNSTILSFKDKESQGHAQWIIGYILFGSKKCHDIVYHTCRYAALAYGLAGVVLLYIDLSGSWSWVLATPIAIYYILLYLSLGILYTICRTLKNKCDGKVASKQFEQNHQPTGCSWHLEKTRVGASYKSWHCGKSRKIVDKAVAFSIHFRLGNHREMLQNPPQAARRLDRASEYHTLG